MEFITNKFPYDLKYVNVVEGKENKEKKCFEIEKKDEKFCLEKTNILYFFKTFYFKEIILFLLSVGFSFIFNKFIFLSGIFLILLYLVMLKEKEFREFYIQKAKVIDFFIFLMSGLVVIFAFLALFNLKVLNNVIFMFFLLYIIFTLNYFIKFYDKYNNNVYLIKDADNNILKGYIAWEK